MLLTLVLAATLMQAVPADAEPTTIADTTPPATTTDAAAPAEVGMPADAGDGPVQTGPLSLLGGELPLPFAYRIRQESISVDVLGGVAIEQRVSLVVADGDRAGDEIIVSLKYQRPERAGDGMVSAVIDDVVADMRASDELVTFAEVRTRGLDMVVAEVRSDPGDDDVREVSFMLDVDGGLLIGTTNRHEPVDGPATMFEPAKGFVVASDARARFDAVAAAARTSPAAGSIATPLGELPVPERFVPRLAGEAVTRNGRGAVRALTRTFLLERGGLGSRHLGVVASCGSLAENNAESLARWRELHSSTEPGERVQVLASGATTFATLPGHWVQYLDGEAESRTHGSEWYAEYDGHFLNIDVWQYVQKADVREYEHQMPTIAPRCDLQSGLRGIVL